jgi:hypothetical protein
MCRVKEGLHAKFQATGKICNVNIKSSEEYAVRKVSSCDGMVAEN